MSTTLEERSSSPTIDVTSPAVPGVKVLEPDAARFQRRLTLVVTMLPFLGVIAAIWMFWGNGLSVVDASIFLAFYTVAGLGVTVGFHRLLTHQSFKAKPWASNVLAVAGSMAIQGPVIRWVADHRRHHAFADQDGDPHSPHLDEGPGVKGVLKGLWHAHMGWLFNDEQTSARRWAPDLVKDPAMRTIDRLFLLWVVISFGAPPVLGFLITGTASGALTAFVWGSLTRIFLLHHVTWSINSICHFYGKRPFETPDYSTNNWPLALISFGESWHNNHHAFPTSAVHGLSRGQLDISGAFIRLMQKLGMASDIKTVSGKQLETKNA
jgi:stearoyl-CoA desaturase (Delta-9 desaturase)